MDTRVDAYIDKHSNFNSILNNTGLHDKYKNC